MVVTLKTTSLWPMDVRQSVNPICQGLIRDVRYGNTGCGVFKRQGRNQDLNLVEQKYEILTCHKNRC